MRKSEIATITKSAPIPEMRDAGIPGLAPEIDSSGHRKSARLIGSQPEVIGNQLDEILSALSGVRLTVFSQSCAGQIQLLH